MESIAQIRKRAEGEYQNFLSSVLHQQDFFPLSISFSKLKTTEEGNILRKWVEEHLQNEQKYGYSLKKEEKNTQKYGKVLYPSEVIFENEPQYLSFLSKKAEFELFRKNAALVLACFPKLKEWILSGKNVFYLTDAKNEWENILAVCRFFTENTDRNFYVRELPIKVHTKFIENNQTLITHLLNYLLPENQIFAEEKPSNKHYFAKRFGLKYPEILIQIRFLDENIQISQQNHFALPLSQFENFSPSCETVFIIENQITFLTFPFFANGIALFGQGNAVALLKKTEWLKNKRIYYWGDIDVEGFAILSTARANISPEIISFLMDMETFHDFYKYAEKGTNSVKEVPKRLLNEEQNMFEYLKKESIDRNRLEQENIDQVYVLNKVKNLVCKFT